jgi:putative hemolysin
MSAWLLLPILALLVVGALSAMVSALETALMVFDADTRQNLRKRNPEVAKDIEPLLVAKKSTQNSLFLSDSILNVILIALCLLVLQNASSDVHLGNLPGWVPVAAALASLVFFCEILPKLIALQRPEGVLIISSALLPLLVNATAPASRLLEIYEGKLSSWVNTGAQQPPDKQTRRDELVALFEIAGEEGVIFPEEAGLMREIVRLGGENAAHCMTPRVDALLLPDDLQNDEVAALLRTRRHRRVPVHGATPDDVLGVLDVEQFLRHPETPYTFQLEPPGFIPESMKALDLLQNFLLGRRKVALLLDEYGGFEGVVTLSDIIDELLGEEGANSASGLYLEKVSPDRLIAGGHARLDDLHDALGIDFSGSQADTLGGFLMERSGGIPRPGTRLPYQGWDFEVRRSSRKRIKEVIVQRLENSQEAAR